MLFATSLALIAGSRPSDAFLTFPNADVVRTMSFKDQFTFLPQLSHRHRPSVALSFGRGDADFMELQVGGMRYEMVELPDSLVDETCFVGNLDEFVTDEMLSILFQQVSSLKFIPACVARKPNASSLKYGFAIFPTVAEKEAAIIRFNGYLLNDKPLRVESIIDYKYRVRVPEKLVCYTVGEAKRTRDGSNNTLRKTANSRIKPTEKKDRKRGKRVTMSRSGGNSRTKTTGKWKKKERRRNRRDDAGSIW